MGKCGSKNNDNSKSYLLQSLNQHTAGINCMALSEDGSVLATGSDDKTARLWSTKTRKCECMGTLVGHTDYINCILIEEADVLTGGADKTIRKWDISSCQCLLVMEGHKSLIYRIICTGDFVISSSYDRTAKCWDFNEGVNLMTFEGHKRGVFSLIFIPSDEEEYEDAEDDEAIDILVTGSADGDAKAWNFETGECLHTFKGHTSAITCMAMDSVGETLFTGSLDHTVRSWNVMTGETYKVFQGHQASVICLQISNKILYTGSSDHTSRSWVSEFAECTRVYRGHKHTVICMRFHEGLSCGDTFCRAFDAKSGALKRTFRGHETAVHTMQIVDNKLFTGSFDGTLNIWNIKNVADEINYDTIMEEEENDEKTQMQMEEIEKIGGL
ncbi:repeat-containing 86-like isoform X2 [Octopus vulgaris]|uniref:Repeat-containing 86-like isoform X2 n=1 Tax=Octopus vulgaris TaxID=6645 RepID=A0AA36BRY0_OCTVU|nr:repeat-containing 86-like isoform X2 [Octopus vulgaris]